MGCGASKKEEESNTKERSGGQDEPVKEKTDDGAAAAAPVDPNDLSLGGKHPLRHLLPQFVPDGQEKMDRDQGIQERQTQYEWAEPSESMPPVVKELPDHYKTLQMAGHFLDMFGPDGSVTKMKLTAEVDKMKEKFGCHDEDPFEDYIDVYPGELEGGKWQVTVPKVAKNGRWKTDKEFGRQRLGGMNPVFCHKLVDGLESVKEKFPITDEMVEGLTEGKTLKELDEAGRLYFTDYSLYEGIQNFDGLHGTVYVPFCLFFVNEQGDMMPLGVQLYQDPNESPIFTPNNDHDGLWLLVKIAVQQMECSNHICSEHLGAMHLWVEAFYVSCRRRLSDKHPINQLFWDSFWSTMPVNTSARALLMNPDGRVPKDFCQGEKGMHEVLKRSLRSKNDFNRWTFPGDVKRRNMEDCPNYLWKDDAGEGWQIWEKFIDKFVDSMYSSNEDLLQDEEVQNWAAELEGILDYENLPIEEGGRWSDLKQFKFFLTTIMWHVTFKHMSIHMTQFEMMAHIPNCPNVIRKKLPMDNTATVTALEIRNEYLPDWDDMITQIGFFAGVVYKPDEGFAIGQFDKKSFIPEDVKGHEEHWALVKEFQDDLEKLSTRVTTRNKEMEEKGDMGYQYLDPHWMWRSIAV